MNDIVNNAPAMQGQPELTQTANIIEVDNPTAEEMADIIESIKVASDFSVNVKSVVFKFKKFIDKATGITNIRKPVTLAIPYPSINGIVHILESEGKGLKLLAESMENIVNNAIRDILSKDFSLDAATFPVDKISWEAISNISKVRSGGIPKEVWDAFAVNYVEVMPKITGKTIEQCTKAARIFQNKFTQVRTRAEVLELLIQQLAIYAENSPKAEEFVDCIDLLLNKAETFLNTSDEDLLAAL